MIDRQQIAKPIIAEFERFMDDYKNVLHSETPLLQSTIEQIMRSNGKHIRPILLLLSAKACGKITPITQETALLVELLHTTTLIHDDVVDETKQRRGIPSLNAIFDNRISVLTGDYILAGIILHAAEMKNFSLITILARACRELSEGELMQLDNADKHSLSEENYMQTIRKKTASLLSACSEIGAISANASPETTKKCRLFGEYLGYCFQIKDDIFDYYDNADIGKPTGNDIKEGKITLPLLHALEIATESDKSQMIEIIEKQSYTTENIEKLTTFAKQNNGIKYAEDKLKEYKQKAVEIIKDSLPPSEARESLLLLADYITERTK